MFGRRLLLDMLALLVLIALFAFNDVLVLLAVLSLHADLLVCLFSRLVVCLFFFVFFRSSVIFICFRMCFFLRLAVSNDFFLVFSGPNQFFCVVSLPERAFLEC